MTSWQIYWLTRLDSLSAFTSFTTGVLLVASIVLAIIWLVTHDGSLFDDDTPKRFVKPFWVCAAVGLFSWFLCIWIPNTKEMAVIIVAPKLYNAISQNEDLKKIPANVIDLANSWLEELKPKGESK